MNKNIRHSASIQDAADTLRKSLMVYKWFVGTTVFQPTISRDVVINKSDLREIVVSVVDEEHVLPPTQFQSWPVRYVVGVRR